jgi:hypothetical protein
VLVRQRTVQGPVPGRDLGKCGEGQSERDCPQSAVRRRGITAGVLTLAAGRPRGITGKVCGVRRVLVLVMLVVFSACTEGEPAQSPTTERPTAIDPELFDAAARSACVSGSESTALSDRELIAAFDTTAADMVETVLHDMNDLGILLLYQQRDDPAALCWYDGPSGDDRTDESPVVMVGYFNEARYGPRPADGPPQRP